MVRRVKVTYREQKKKKRNTKRIGRYSTTLNSLMCYHHWSHKQMFSATRHIRIEIPILSLSLTRWRILKLYIGSQIRVYKVCSTNTVKEKWSEKDREREKKKTERGSEMARTCSILYTCIYHLNVCALRTHGGELAASKKHFKYKCFLFSSAEIQIREQNLQSY